MIEFRAAEGGPNKSLMQGGDTGGTPQVDA